MSHLLPYEMLACSVILGFACHTPDKPIDTNAANSLIRTPPETGLYVLDLGNRLFTMRLDDVGDYQITSEIVITGQKRYQRQQRGRWRWISQRKEFLLTPDPASAGLDFEFRRLRVDDRHPNTLQWLPSWTFTGGLGLIDYIRLRRED